MSLAFRKLRPLLAASTGQGSQRFFLNAALQDRLTAEYGDSAKDAGQPFGPGSRVAHVAAR